MSGLSILGGLASGITQGLNNTMAIERYRTQQSREQEKHDAWKQQQEREAADRERAEGWNTLSMRIDSEYGTLDPIDRNAMKLQYGMQTGLIAPQEFETLQKQRQQLESDGLLNDIISGNTDAIAQKFTRRMGQPVGVSRAKDANGREVYRLSDQSGKVLREINDEHLGVLLGVDRLVKLGEVDRTNQEHTLKQQKTRSEIGENQAQASAASALAAQRRADAAGAGGAGGGLSMLKGQPAAVKEAAFVAELEGKVTRGVATPQEEAMLRQLRSRTEPKTYTPAAVKSANYWRSAPASEIEAEVDRQVSAALAKAPPGSWERDQLERPEALDAIRRDIRGRLGVPAPAPAPKKSMNLDSYFK